MGITTDFIAFLVAVFGRWQHWASGGGIGGAVLLLLYFYERMSGIAMPKRMYAALVIGAFLFAAFFTAWRDQYHTALAAMQRVAEIETEKSPDLKGEIGIVAVAPAGPKNSNSIVTLFATIKNTGAPSIADSMLVTIKMTNGRKVQLTPLGVPRKELTLSGKPNEPNVVFQREDYLPEKAISNPIPTGGAVQGFVWGVALGAEQREVINKGTIIVISFKDIQGNDRSIVKVMGNGEGFGVLSPKNIQSLQH